MAPAAPTGRWLTDDIRAPGRRSLVADIPPTHPRIARVLTGFDLEFVTNLAGAVTALGGRAFDLVIVGIDLDESSALEVVPRVRGLAPETPVICVRAAAAKYRVPNATVYGFRLACELVGATGFVNFFDFADDAAGDTAIREVIENMARVTPTGACPAG